MEVQGEGQAAERQGTPQGEPQGDPKGEIQGQGGEENRTYTGKELGEAVSKRLAEEMDKAGVKDWKAIGITPQEARERLARLEQFEKVSKKEGGPELDPNMKQLKNVLLQLFPRLEKLDEISGGVEQISQREFARAVDAGHSEINSMAAQLEITDPAQQQFLHDLVAASIQRSPEDLNRWSKTGDIAIVKKHFTAVSEGFLRNLMGKKDASYGKAKDKTAKLPPRMPQGGTPAVTAKKEKMSDEERASAGFELLTANSSGD